MALAPAPWLSAGAGAPVPALPKHASSAFDYARLKGLARSRAVPSALPKRELAPSATTT